MKFFSCSCGRLGRTMLEPKSPLLPASAVDGMLFTRAAGRGLYGVTYRGMAKTYGGRMLRDQDGQKLSKRFQGAPPCLATQQPSKIGRAAPNQNQVGWKAQMIQGKPICDLTIPSGNHRGRQAHRMGLASIASRPPCRFRCGDGGAEVIERRPPSEVDHDSRVPPPHAYMFLFYN